MFLETRSIERALAAIDFFNRIIPRSVARVTDISVVNRLFEATPAAQGLMSPLDSLFANETGIDPEARLNDLQERLEKARQGVDEQSRSEASLGLFEEIVNEPFPEVERFPTHYYEDGIGPLRGALKMRQIAAINHWKGNTDFSLHDMLSAITQPESARRRKT